MRFPQPTKDFINKTVITIFLSCVRNRNCNLAYSTMGSCVSSQEAVVFSNETIQPDKSEKSGKNDKQDDGYVRTLVAYISSDFKHLILKSI